MAGRRLPLPSRNSDPMTRLNVAVKTATAA
jgi:hypothetical protein